MPWRRIMSPGPILGYEMVRLARNDRLHWLRTGFAIVVGVIAFRWWSAAGGLEPSAFVGLSSQSFTMLVVIQYLAIYLLTPVLVCTALSRDRAGGSTDLWFVSGLTAREIVLGKLGSRLLFAALPVLSCAPLLALLPLLGGVEPTAVWRSQAGALLALLFVGATSMRCAAECRSALGTLLQSYSGCATIAGALWFASCLSPVRWLTVAMLPWSGFDWSWEPEVWSPWGLVVPVVFSLVLIAMTLRRLDPRRELAGLGGSPDRVSFGRSAWFLLTVAVAIFLVQAFVIVLSLAVELLEIFLWMGLYVATVLVAVRNPVVDRQRGFCDLVLQTPLHPREILRLADTLGWRELAPAYLTAALATIALGWVRSAGCFDRWPVMLGYGAVLWMIATMVSLGDGSSQRTAGDGPLSSAFFYVVMASFGYHFCTGLGMTIADMLEQIVGVGFAFVWPIPGVMFLSLSGMYWQRWRQRRTAAAAVGFCAGVQLLFLGFACLVTTHLEYLAVGTTPAFWFMTSDTFTFDDRFNRTELARVNCFGLVLYLIWLRWFTIRNFDSLVGRPVKLLGEAPRPGRGSRKSTPQSVARDGRRQPGEPVSLA